MVIFVVSESPLRLGPRPKSRAKCQQVLSDLWRPFDYEVAKRQSKKMFEFRVHFGVVPEL
jgi:hypothetical protein